MLLRACGYGNLAGVLEAAEYLASSPFNQNNLNDESQSRITFAGNGPSTGSTYQVAVLPELLRHGESIISDMVQRTNALADASYDVSVGFSGSVNAANIRLSAGGGAVASLNTQIGELSFGLFYQHQVEATTSPLPAIGLSANATYGRGDLESGFMGPSSVFTTTSHGVINAAGSYIYNDQYYGYGFSAGLSAGASAPGFSDQSAVTEHLGGVTHIDIPYELEQLERAIISGRLQL